MAQQLDGEGRGPGGVGGERPGGAGGNAPTGLGRALLGLRLQAQQEDGGAGLGGGERQAARGGEVEHLRRPPGLDDDGAERGTARRFQPRLEDAEGIFRLDKDEVGRIEAEAGKTGAVEASRLHIDEGLANPDDGLVRAVFFGRGVVEHAPGEGGGKAGRSAGVEGAGGKDLMQRAAAEPAFQEPVEIGRAEPGFPFSAGRGDRVVHGVSRESRQLRAQPVEFRRHGLLVVLNVPILFYESTAAERSQCGRFRGLFPFEIGRWCDSITNSLTKRSSVTTLVSY